MQLYKQEKGPEPVGTVGRIESIMVALYHNVTDYLTVNHLTLLLNKYSL